MVAHKGKVALQGAFGYASRERGEQMKEDHVFPIFSVSKAMIATGIMQYLDRGLICLTTPVAELLPAFAASGKQRITIGQLLCHSGGMSGGLPMIPFEDQVNLEKAVVGICMSKLEAMPGETVSYSPIMGFAILGELIRLLDGGKRSLREVMDDTY